jgi:hypothetical protein
MGSVEQFEQGLAKMLGEARAEFRFTEGVHDDRRDDAVTVWRCLASLANSYRGEGSWEDLWDVDETAQFAAKLRAGSRFNRCRADGMAELSRDSVARFEEELVSLADTGALELGRQYVAAGRKDVAYRVRALELEHGAVMKVISLYTGLPTQSLAERSTQYRTYAGGATECDEGSLLAVIREHRPVYGK